MIDIPTMKEFQKVIPSHCFNCKTITSLRYLFQSIIIQCFVVAIGLTIPIKHQMLPIWVLYAFISGTTAMGFWVIAHECGHGAFSKKQNFRNYGWISSSFTITSSIFLVATIMRFIIVLQIT